MFRGRALQRYVLAAASDFVIVLFSGLMLGARMAERDNLRAQHPLGTQASDIKNWPFITSMSGEGCVSNLFPGSRSSQRIFR